MNCKPGDLAICVGTDLPVNDGLILRVVRPHVNTPDWDFGELPTWWCVSDEEMTWHFRRTNSLVRGHEGPVPDAVLRPIRPGRPKESQHTHDPLATRREEELMA